MELGIVAGWLGEFTPNNHLLVIQLDVTVCSTAPQKKSTLVFEDFSLLPLSI